MRLNRAFVITLVVITMVSSVFGVYPAGATPPDEHPEYCSEISSSSSIEGTYSGTMNSPEDRDVLGKIDVEPGEYVSVKVQIPRANQEFWLMAGTDGEHYVSGSDEINDAGGHGDILYVDIPGRTAYATFYLEGSGPGTFCLTATQIYGTEADNPYDWEIEVIENEKFDAQEPTPTPTRTPTPTTTPSPTPTLTPSPTPTTTPSPEISTDVVTTGTQSTSTTNPENEQESEVHDRDGDGVIDSEDYAPRDPKVQEKSDLTNGTNNTSSPGFGLVAGILALMILVIYRTH